MRIGVISLVGTTAPIVTEAIDYTKSLYPRDRIYNIMISTSDDRIIKNAEFAKKIIEKEYKRNVISIIKVIKVSDFTNESTISKFIDQISEILYEEENKYELDKIILNITGGRKVQTMLMYFLSQFDEKISIVINIINKNIKSANYGWEQVKRYLDESFSNDEYESIIKPVMFPTRSEYSVLHLPRFVLPRIWRNEIYDTLIDKEPSSIYDTLIKSGLLSKTKDGIAVLTDMGQAIKNALMRFRV